MSSVLFNPRSETPQNMEELITLVYLGRLEKQPWLSFLRQLRVLTGSDVSMLLLGATPPQRATILYWNAAASITENLLHGERCASTENYRVDIARRSAWFPVDDSPHSPLSATFCSQRCMHLFGLSTFVSAHGEHMSCCLGRIEGGFGSRETQILQLLTPHLNRV